MSSKISRRKLLQSSVAVGLGTGAASLTNASPFAASTLWKQTAVKPLVIASGNGLDDKNGGKESCVERAFRLMTAGSDVLDALIEGANIVELDPNDPYVGYGGLPNADGVVQLDSCCMHGPKKWAGGVACLEGIRTPSKVAKAVMERTDHHLLVGKGAQDFARGQGFTVEADLNTEFSRKTWQEWKRRTDPEHYLDPTKREEIGRQAALAMIAEGLIDQQHYYGTLNVSGINEKAEICGVTTTSGLAFKMPGRVGDSPILGAGLYVDGEIGAAGSTGRGEANLYNLSSYLIIEGLRKGLHPKDAGMEALKRISGNTIEKRLLDGKGHPSFGLQFYILDKQGRHAAVNMIGAGVRYAVCDEKGPRYEVCDGLY